VIAERARFRYSKKIERAVGYRVPDQAFSGTMLDAIYSHLDFDRLDHTLKEQILSFFDSFLRCDCRDAPLCGCPERKFSGEIIGLRENGLDHRQISEYLLDEYGIDIYPADVLSFLEESVHVLEAIRDIAVLKNVPLLIKAAREHIELIER
jgi:superfamily II helicase